MREYRRLIFKLTPILKNGRNDTVMLASARRGRALHKLCVYTASGEWIDTVRIYRTRDGYLVMHMEDDDVYEFGNLEDALAYITTVRLHIDGPVRVGECPPPPGLA
jgi:hypothetical protein